MMTSDSGLIFWATLYGLRVLRAHGLSQDCLEQVFCYTVLAKLLYASPALAGFCPAADVNKLNNFVNKLKKAVQM